MNGPFADLDALLRQLDAALAENPAYADLLNLRALARAHAGRLDAAQADLEAAIDANPGYDAALANLAWVHLERGDEDAYRQLGDSAAARALPETWRAHLERLAIRQALGAPAALQGLDADTPGGATGPDPWLALDRLWLLVEAGREHDARLQLLALVAHDPELLDVLEGIGVFHGHEPVPAGVQLWAATYRGNPLGAALCRAGADMALRGGAPGEARGLLRWSAALSLDNCAYWVATAAHLQMQADEHGARAALERAVHADPERAEARVALGDLYAACGLPHEAVAELERAVQLAPRYADLRYRLALLYTDLGVAARAEDELRAALDMQPGYVLARLALGCVLESQNRDREALALLQSVRQAGLSSADLDNRLANLHARLGHRIQARRAGLRARASRRAGAARRQGD